MCWSVIVDANCFGDLNTSAGRELRDWLRRRHGTLYYPAGGRGAEELGRGRTALLFETLREAGYARRLGRQTLRRGLSALSGKAMLSNDPHVLALAWAAQARLLVSRDEKLRRDFRGDVLPAPTAQAHEAFPVPREVYPIDEAAESRRRFLAERRCPLRGVPESLGD